LVGAHRERNLCAEAIPSWVQHGKERRGVSRIVTPKKCKHPFDGCLQMYNIQAAAVCR
jgi:hypothetical protein